MRREIPILALLALTTLCGCEGDTYPQAKAMTGGDPDRGTEKIAWYGCASCHTIPGIPGADSLVGPPLNNIGDRQYIGGVLKNTPENLERWIHDPPAVDSKTDMPNMHIPDADARDIAAYLYTLR